MYNNEDLQSCSKASSLLSGKDSDFKHSQFNQVVKNINVLNSLDDSINVVENWKGRGVSCILTKDCMIIVSFIHENKSNLQDIH